MIGPISASTVAYFASLSCVPRVRRPGSELPRWLCLTMTKTTLIGESGYIGIWPRAQRP
jgi:hypothetical protein